jgi:hypothetical protein
MFGRGGFVSYRIVSCRVVRFGYTLCLWMSSLSVCLSIHLSIFFFMHVVYSYEDMYVFHKSAF